LNCSISNLSFFIPCLLLVKDRQYSLSEIKKHVNFYHCDTNNLNFPFGADFMKKFALTSSKNRAGGEGVWGQSRPPASAKAFLFRASIRWRAA